MSYRVPLAACFHAVRPRQSKSQSCESSAAGWQVLPLPREVGFPFVIKLLSALGRTMYSQFHFLFSCHWLRDNLLEEAEQLMGT